MIKRVVLWFIVFYQKTMSYNWGIFGFLNTSCKFHPSCSSYSYGVINKFGIKKGLKLSIIRLIKCNPLSRGGYDDIPNN